MLKNFNFFYFIPLIFFSIFLGIQNRFFIINFFLQPRSYLIKVFVYFVFIIGFILFVFNSKIFPLISRRISFLDSLGIKISKFSLKFTIYKISNDLNNLGRLREFTLFKNKFNYFFLSENLFYRFFFFLIILLFFY